MSRFFGASNAFDGGNYEVAEQRLRDYLEGHPASPWRTLARLLLAETLSSKGDDEAAEAIWRALPESRQLYGALRLKGLLPTAAVDNRPAAGAAEPASP
ncbi:MAG: tetratricopeptide repeat protein [Planctomycetota bacterium]|jgi:thioredoxin-like negative regulator of GroEL